MASDTDNSKVYYRPSKDELPKGAIKLSGDEILARQWEQITNWKNPKEIWSLTWGTGVLGGGTALFGTVLTGFYRKQLYLKGLNVGVSLLPAAILPATFSMIANSLFVTNNILNGQLSCPSCAQVRAASIHLGIGCVYPLIFSPIICGAIAKRFNTYNMPSFLDGRQIFKLWHQLTKPHFSKIGFGIIAQVLLAIYITDQQQRAFGTLMQKGSLVQSR